MNSNEQIERLILIITNQCNSRCRHCNIWLHGRNRVELASGPLLEALRESKACKDLRRINISGGEPMLYKGLIQLTEGLGKLFGLQLLLSCISNASLPEETVAFADSVSRNSRLQLFISVDGADEATNKSVRGIKDGYSKAIGTIKQLIELNRHKNAGIRIGISFTIVKQNYHHTRAVYDLSKSLGIDFICRPFSEFEVFYQLKDYSPVALSEDELRDVCSVLRDIAKEDDSISTGQRWFFSNMSKGYTGKEKVPCVAGHKSACIRANGDVSRCLFDKSVAGNIWKMPLDDILSHYNSRPTRNCSCWNDCETISNYEHSLLGESERAGW